MACQRTSNSKTAPTNLIVRVFKMPPIATTLHLGPLSLPPPPPPQHEHTFYYLGVFILAVRSSKPCITASTPLASHAVTHVRGDGVRVGVRLGLRFDA